MLPVTRGNDVGQVLTGAEILDAERRDAPADRVHRIREQILTGADLPAHPLEERLALAERVAVDQDFLGRVQRTALARIDRVILPLHHGAYSRSSRLSRYGTD